MGKYKYLESVILASLLGITGLLDVSFVSSNSPTSNDQWFVTWGGKLDERAWGMVVNGSHIYITGDTTSFGAGDYDIFLLKFDLEGNLQWNTTWGSSDRDFVWGIAVYGDSVYLTGDIFRPHEGLLRIDVVLLKYNNDGELLWNITWDGDDFALDTARDIAVTDDGVFLTGESGRGAFLLKYNYEGQLQWEKTWEIKDGLIKPQCISIEDAQIFVTGFFRDPSLELDYNIFLTKFNIDGQQIWNTTWGGTDRESPTGMVTVEDGIYISGLASGAKVDGLYEWDVILLKFDKLGNLQWSDRWGGPKHERSMDLTVYDDFIYVIGKKRVFIEDNVLDEDVLLLEYDSTGRLRSKLTWGGTGVDSGRAISVVEGALYISGLTTSFGEEGNVTRGGGESPNFNVFLMKVAGSLSEVAPKQAEDEPELKGAGGIPGFPYVSVILGLIIVVIFIWQLKGRRLVSARLSRPRKPF